MIKRMVLYRNQVGVLSLSQRGFDDQKDGVVSESSWSSESDLE